MPIWIIVIFIFLIFQRLLELRIAKHNETYLKNRGAIELGKEHYKWFIIVHIAFFIAMIVEMILAGLIVTAINPFLFILFLLTQITRIWCISSLGVYWNTKIIILPDSSLMKKGPYKYIKHPNYLIVG
ncbi:MAG TPA: isoprenylcysteine carboxylmethyltransferase family protein, partial [Bacillota bacterium]|nr:isoprenylcysteine carboxylmethyltransferase family protein [Bacillota bacterium]